MTYLSTTQLTMMRATVAGTFSGTAIIQRKGWTSDGAGGSTADYAAVGTVSCQTTPRQAAPTNEVIAAQLAGRAPYLIIVPYDTDIRDGDQIQADGRMFEVIQALSQDWELELPVVCVEFS